MILFGQAHSAETKVLRALALIESGNDPEKRGKRGEISAYQIMPKVWRSYTNYAYHHTKPHIAAAVANRHGDWLVVQFLRYYKRTPNEVEFYCMWNLGWTKFKVKYKGQVMSCPAATQDAALRFNGLLQQQYRN